MQKDLANVLVAELGREHKREVAQFAPVIHVGLFADQKLDSGFVVLPGRKNQWGRAMLVWCVDRNAMFDTQIDRRDVACIGGVEDVLSCTRQLTNGRKSEHTHAVVMLQRLGMRRAAQERASSATRPATVPAVPMEPP